jgi:DNA repair photolyase
MTGDQRPAAKGRGSRLAPANRFTGARAELEFDQFEHDPEYLESLRNVPTEYLADTSKSIVSENNSPDIPFRYSLNPYRGCAHGCSYCYARPYHEYLGLNAGLDFETKIFVKHDAPRLFREFLARPAWKPEPITFSGVTDCYQPAERQFRLTRGCLEVACEFHQPVSIITKNALVCRDLDLIQSLAAENLTQVNISVTTLDAELARTMEPRTSTPAARLQAIRTLTAAGVSVRVMVAPIIPGLNDSEVPEILAAAHAAGAQAAGYTLLRLPLAVAPVFQEWLERTQPTKRERVEGLVRQTRAGKLNGSEFGSRMRGTGEIAEQIGRLFRVFSKKYQLDRKLPALDVSKFEPPRPRSGQLRLF